LDWLIENVALSLVLGLVVDDDACAKAAFGVVADLVLLVFPTFPILGLSHLWMHRLVFLSLVFGCRCSLYYCWLLTLTHRNSLDCLLAQSLQVALSSNGNYNNNHILYMYIQSYFCKIYNLYA
jgi:hypothetical protein